MTQTIVNLGTGGAVLNGQNGSTGGADSNDALFLDWDGRNYVYITTALANFMSVPDEAALDITGDIDVRVHVALDAWIPSATQVLAAKRQGPSTETSWVMGVTTTGLLFFAFSANGTALVRTVSSSVATGVTNGTAKWVRATLDVDNGASGNDVKFFLSDDGLTWTQLGTTSTAAGVTSIYNSAVVLEVGSQYVGTNSVASGKFYRAQILNGIDGTTVLDVDTSVISSGAATSFTAITGQTVTINRNVSVSSRKAVAVVTPTWLFGVDDFISFPFAGLSLATVDQGLTVFLFLRRWPYPVGNHAERMFNNLNNVASPVWSGVLLGTQNDTEDVGTFVRDNEQDQVASNTSTNELHTDGTLDVYGAVLDRASQTWKAYVNGSEVASSDASTIDAITPEYDLFLARPASGNLSYMEAEVFGGAVWQRALTADEVVAVTTYYQNKVA